MSPDDDPRDETSAERLDRNLSELMGELRVVVTGIQVLFAFLLVVPFDQRFGRVTAFERVVYFVTLCLSALAAALVIAPTAYHRMLFRRGEKRAIVSHAQALTLAGLGALSLAMAGSLTLVASVLFGAGAGIATGAAAALVFALLWFALPWTTR